VDALTAFRADPTRFDLVITDMNMPHLNGMQLVKELKNRLVAIRPAIKALFMSGYTSDVIMHRGVLEDHVHFLQKPFSINGLAGTVRQVLDASASNAAS
jgi:YesN/AraC family two-component response regulator